MQLGRPTTRDEERRSRNSSSIDQTLRKMSRSPIRTTRQPTRHLFRALPLNHHRISPSNQGSISILILESPRSTCTKSGHDMIKGCAAKQNSSRPARQNPLNSIHVLHASETLPTRSYRSSNIQATWSKPCLSTPSSFG
ncbi:hypothetical protein KVT40_005511 [Elsinoe batatas]|uniref:Uncharacterized protein n=1 Tax=Elsinoe batatas TaxID=2601811 RepID=A0A8K0PEA6_9PEZI|nr:hypothetical protein KVT40_005511 [Elsinoe batatas]